MNTEYNKINKIYSKTHELNIKLFNLYLFIKNYFELIKNDSNNISKNMLFRIIRNKFFEEINFLKKEFKNDLQQKEIYEFIQKIEKKYFY